MLAEIETKTVIEEDPRQTFQFQTVQEHTLRAIRRITEPVTSETKVGKFAEVQKEFEKKVSN